MLSVKVAAALTVNVSVPALPSIVLPVVVKSSVVHEVSLCHDKEAYYTTSLSLSTTGTLVEEVYDLYLMKQFMFCLLYTSPSPRD